MAQVGPVFERTCRAVRQRNFCDRSTLSIDGKFGDEAHALLDEQVIADAQDWLIEYTR